MAQAGLTSWSLSQVNEAKHHCWMSCVMRSVGSFVVGSVDGGCELRAIANTRRIAHTRAIANNDRQYTILRILFVVLLAPRPPKPAHEASPVGSLELTFRIN